MIRHRYESEFDIEYKFKVGDRVIYRGKNSMGVQGDKGVVRDMHFDQEDAYDSNWYRVDFELSGMRNVYEKNLELDPIQNRFNNLKKMYGEEVVKPKFQVGDRVILKYNQRKGIVRKVLKNDYVITLDDRTPNTRLDTFDHLWADENYELDPVYNRFKNLQKMYGDQND
jgi:hypothetical protein